MLSANFKPKRTAAASLGFLATARLSCFLNITRDEERQRLKTFRILIKPLPSLHGLPTRSYIKCGLLTYPCGLLSMWAYVLWAFVLWAFVRVGFCPDTVKLQDYEVRVGVKVTVRVRVRILISASALIIEFVSVRPAL